MFSTCSCALSLVPGSPNSVISCHRFNCCSRFDSGFCSGSIYASPSASPFPSFSSICFKSTLVLASEYCGPEDMSSTSASIIVSVYISNFFVFSKILRKLSEYFFGTSFSTIVFLHFFSLSSSSKRCESSLTTI